MISVIMTSYMEPDTVGQAIDACLRQLPPDGELLVVAPDEPTVAVVSRWMAQDMRVRHVQDQRTGKPAALNLGLAAARYDTVVLTDGDVLIADGALSMLCAPFADERVGAVSGRVVSISPRGTMLGYWSHLLVDAAHQTRFRRSERGVFILCTGYLFAYRKALMPWIPVDALAEDAVISHRIAEQGYRIAYASTATVSVKYPTTYRDWLLQKVRSAGGYAQSYITDSPVRMRSAWLEVRDGTRFALTYGQNLREHVWTLWLFAARLHLWLLVYWRVRVRRLPLSTLWQRVTTTK